MLDNSHLKIATSRNYHHFFPKDYLKDVDPSEESNLVANITLIDGYSNKHRIGKKAPSKYIQKFGADNKNLARTLRTHLIEDVAGFGIRSDDYATFIARRSQAIAEHLNSKLRPTTGRA